MSMDEHDIEWRCGCGHTNPDFDYYCNECLEVRFPEEKATTAPPASTDETAGNRADRNYSGSDTSKITDASEVTK